MDDVPKEVRNAIEKAFPGGFTYRDEANALTAWAFRNGPLEDLHAGKSSKLLSDSGLSRITDDEMKQLMICASTMLEELLRMREEEPEKYFEKIVAYNMMYCRSWER